MPPCGWCKSGYLFLYQIFDFSLKTLSIKLQFCIPMLSRQNFRQLVKKDWFWSKNSENGVTKTALAAKLANYCWNVFLFWGGKGWKCNTDRQTISLTSYTGVCRFFFQLNLLPPYSLCSQGDNLILESDTFVCSGDESKSCHITSIFALAYLACSENLFTRDDVTSSQTVKAWRV